MRSTPALPTTGASIASTSVPPTLTIALFTIGESATDAAAAFPTDPNRARRLNWVFFESCFKEFPPLVHNIIFRQFDVSANIFGYLVNADHDALNTLGALPSQLLIRTFST
jgi:hypothetical protein